MIVTTTDGVQGSTIDAYLGIVTAEVVYGSNALRDFFAGIRDIVGGRTAGYERVFGQGQREAIAELEQRANASAQMPLLESKLIQERSTSTSQEFCF